MSFRGALARRLGWSPAGKDVSLKIDEAAHTAMVGSRIRGRIVSADERRATMQLRDALPSGDKLVDVYPRHHGYDFHHLRFGPIAVYLARHGDAAADVAGDSRFASGMMTMGS